MKLLLDTHAFIWWDSEPSRLSPRALALCQGKENVLILSVVTAWEMQIKSRLGKLKLNMPLASLLADQQLTNKVEVLPVTLAHVLALDSSPMHHHDPFDRLLIAQAQVEGAVLMSKDTVFARYAVQTIW